MMDRRRRRTQPLELERVLLLKAQAGDEHAFRELVEQHRAAVLAHCYRMLGSMHDAEDAYQDTILRAWRALDGFEERSKLSTWLYRIATNVCLSALRRQAGRRSLLVDPMTAAGGGATSRWSGVGLSGVEPFADALVEVPAGLADPGASYDRREAIELAFVVALQHLPARQRAALVLNDVVGFRPSEIAEVLQTTTTAVNSALQRARTRLDALRPQHSQQQALRAVGDQRVTDLVNRFVEALEHGDVAALTGLMTDDITFEMSPEHDQVVGRDDVAESWLVPTTRPTGLRALAMSANAQPAVAVYRQLADGAAHDLIAVDVIGIASGQISSITAFRTPRILATLGIPLHLSETREVVDTSYESSMGDPRTTPPRGWAEREAR